MRVIPSTVHQKWVSRSPSGRTTPSGFALMLVTINPTLGNSSPWCHSTLATTRRGRSQLPAWQVDRGRPRRAECGFIYLWIIPASFSSSLVRVAMKVCSSFTILRLVALQAVLNRVCRLCGRSRLSRPPRGLGLRRRARALTVLIVTGAAALERGDLLVRGLFSRFGCGCEILLCHG